MITLTRLGIAIFAIAAVAGPLYTVQEYSVISDLISELGAQNTKNNYIMITAFMILGGSIAVDGVRKFHVSLLPFILFGLAMAVVGVFPHKPLNPSLAYNPTYHQLHGIMASVAGTVITVGFAWQGFRTHKMQRAVCFYVALVAMIFPVLMLSFPGYQGIIQRIMYIQILGWVWVKYPDTLAKQPLHRTC